MYVFNFKINGNKLAKILFTVMIIIILLIMFIAIYNIFVKDYMLDGKILNVSYTLKPSEIYEVNSANYTNILKAANENIDDYVGCKVHLIGYIYRLIDFNENQFVVARDMIVTKDKQSLVVGFLSEYNNAKSFEDGTWVDVVGQITKGDFNGEIAILKIIQIKRINKPKDEFVYPPDDIYIPTSNKL